jgi:hypothetical protein
LAIPLFLRWGSWHDCVENCLLPNFHRKLLVLFALGLEQGWINTNNTKQRIMESMDSHDLAAFAATDGTKESTKESAEKMQKLRDNCRNALHTSLMAMMQPGFFFDLGVMNFATLPLRRWHGDVACTLKSPAASLAWYEMMAKMGDDCTLNKALCEVMQPCDRDEALVKLGFLMRAEGPAMAKQLQDWTSPVRLSQLIMAKKLWNLNVHIVHQFLVGFSWCYMSYPGKFAKLLTTSEVERAQAWNDCWLDWLAFKAAQQRRGAPWKNFVKRSCFNWASVREVFMAAETNQGRLDDSILAHVRRVFEFQGCEGSTEVAFQQIKAAERDAHNGRISPAQVWRRPVQWGLFENRYEFQVIDPSTVRDNDVIKAKLPTTLYKPSEATSSMNFKDLPGYGPPSWPTFSAASYNIIAGQTAHMRYCMDNDCWEEGAVAWRSEFLQPGIVVESPEGVIALVLGTCPPMVLLWPCEVMVIGGANFFGLKGKVQWMPCLSLDTWEGYPTECALPLDAMQANDGQTNNGPTVFARQLGDKMTIIKFAATAGFWNLPMVAIKRLARNDLGLEVSDADDAQNTFQVIQAILECDDEEACWCLERRCEHFASLSLNDVDHLLNTPECLDAIDEHDRKEAKSHAERTIHNEVAMKELTSTVAAKMARAVAAKKRRKKMPRTELPSDEAAYGQDFVMNLLPPHSRIFKDHYNSRWLLWYRSPGLRVHGPWRSKSRSWMQRGHAEAVKQLLSMAWQHAMLFGEICPIEGLDLGTQVQGQAPGSQAQGSQAAL